MNSIASQDTKDVLIERERDACTLLDRCVSRSQSCRDYQSDMRELSRAIDALESAQDAVSSAFSRLQYEYDDGIDMMNEKLNMLDLSNLVKDSEVIATRREVKYLLQMMYDQGFSVPDEGQFIDYQGLRPGRIIPADPLECASRYFENERTKWIRWADTRSPEEKHALSQYHLSEELLEMMEEENLTGEELNSLIDWILCGRSVYDGGGGYTRLQALQDYSEMEAILNAIPPVARRKYLSENLPHDLESANGIEGIEKLFRFLLLEIDKLRAEKQSEIQNREESEEDMPFIIDE